MAMLQFFRGSQANLASQTVVNGGLYFTTDSHRIYMGTASGLQEYSAIEVVASISALPAVADAIKGKFYYAEAENVFCFAHENVWQQVNPDTGATSIEVVGEGNAVTEASYDPVTRKITLTKGETFATQAALTEHANAAAGTYETKEDAGKKLTEAKGYTDTEVAKVQGEVDALEELVGTIPEGATATNIVGYVQEKTAGIATDVALGELTDRVTDAEKAIEDIEKDYLVEADKTALLGKIDTKAAQEDLNTATDRITAIENANKEGGAVATAIATAQSAAEAAQGAAEAAQGDVDALEELVGEIPDGLTVAVMLHDVQQLAGDAMAEAEKKVASVTAADKSVTIGGTSTAPTVAAKLSADADNALTLAEDGLKVVIPAAAEYSIVKAENSGEYAAIYNLTKDGAIVGASINIPKDMVVESGAVVENPEGMAAGTYIKLVLQNVAEPLYINVGSLIEYVTSGSTEGDMVVINVSDDHKVTATITDGSITLAKLNGEIQTAIGKAHIHENATVLAGITADQVEAWDAAEANAKAHADGLNGAMDTRVKALEAIDHDHANKEELDLIATGDKAKWDAAAAIAHEHDNKTVIDGITAEKVAAWDAAQANAEATAAGALASAKSELEGKITAAETAAKSHADTEVGKVQDALDTYKTENDAAVAGKADKATTLAGYGIADAMTKTEIEALLTWGEF